MPNFSPHEGETETFLKVEKIKKFFSFQISAIGLTLHGFGLITELYVAVYNYCTISRLLPCRIGHN
jgi:hypothetical protein